MVYSTLAEVEEAIQKADPRTRHQTLRAVTDLFLSACSNLGEEQVEVFDGVFESLVKETDGAALVDEHEGQRSPSGNFKKGTPRGTCY